MKILPGPTKIVTYIEEELRGIFVLPGEVLLQYIYKRCSLLKNILQCEVTKVLGAP